MLEVSNLSASWEGRPVIEGITFDLSAGEIICIVGRSGSGKTTLFHALAGLTEPDSGTVVLDGDDITGAPGHVGYMLQKDLLLAQRTVLDNVCLPLIISGEPRSSARDAARPLFGAFGLAGCEERYPRQLSGGMRQRAALLRTYLMGRPVMLMDEPFSALDALTREEMQRWFQEMARELRLSVILVTHDIAEALLLADRILVLGAASEREPFPTTVVGSLQVDVPEAERGALLAGPEGAHLREEVLRLLH